MADDTAQGGDGSNSNSTIAVCQQGGILSERDFLRSVLLPRSTFLFPLGPPSLSSLRLDR